MSYRSQLEARVAKKVTKAITDHLLVEDGDRVMVGLSGGKDSWALLHILHELRQGAPIDFSIIAVNVDSGYRDYKHDVIARTCEARGWEYRIEHTTIGNVMDDLLEANATPCSLCARLRRGVLYRVATEVGATKIALGHHRDDILETFFLNLFHGGKLKAMPPKLVSDDGKHVVIRPLAYVDEPDLEAYAGLRQFPIIPCDLCGSQDQLQRKQVKAMLREWEKKQPGRLESIFGALTHVAPSHLLDRSLFDFANIEATGEPVAHPIHLAPRVLRAVPEDSP